MSGDRLAKLTLTAIIAISLGLYVGGHPTLLPEPLRDLFVNEQVALQAEALDAVEQNYYKKVDLSKLESESLRGMVDSLDDNFSAYLDRRHYSLFKEDTKGRYFGVGLVAGEHKRGLRVAEVFEGSPAKKSGIKVGEVIIAVDGRSIAGDRVDVATALIKGREGTEVRLRMLGRDGKRRTVRLKRASIKAPLAKGKLVRRAGKKLGVVRLSKFSDGADGAVAREAKSLRRRGVKGFVFDLRSNPGGLLDESVSVSSLFIKRGPIVSTRGRKQPTRNYRATGRAAFANVPLVVLVDRHTASAAEIVTGALKDRDRATVVGLRTFGKGVFQELLPLANGGALDLTVGRYFTPDGFDLGGKGIKPDVVARDNPKSSTDEALNRALSVLARGAK